MLSAMDRVGKVMRDKYFWVSSDEIIYLILDNAGGHGTDNAISAYTKNMLDTYNIESIHQVPRSPFTNVLDLGVWALLQAVVEKIFYASVQCGRTS